MRASSSIEREDTSSHEVRDGTSPFMIQTLNHLPATKAGSRYRELESRHQQVTTLSMPHAVTIDVRTASNYEIQDALHGDVLGKPRNSLRKEPRNS